MVSIRVYDILDREVRVLVNEMQPAGAKSVRWDGMNGGGNQVATGVYFYRIEARNLGGRNTLFARVKKMMLLR